MGQHRVVIHVAVAVAGALGALARFWVGAAFAGGAMPWATLAVNTSGSFLLGFVLGGPGAGRWDTTLITAVTVGFLGAFTTFSTFAQETVAMLRDGRVASALVYVAASVAVGLVAVAAGYAVGRATA